jgi:hypothetical protein
MPKPVSVLWQLIGEGTTIAFMLEVPSMLKFAMGQLIV